MTSYALKLSVPKHLSDAIAASTFYWTSRGQSSFHSSVGPRLGQIGPVPQLNIELVRLAVAVYAADRSTPRGGGGSNWSARDLELTVPVADPAPWQSIETDLSSVIGFLTGDHWSLEFVGSRPARELVSTSVQGVSRVLLLSGGADSAVGALVSRSELGEQLHVLVSHVGATTIAPVQRNVAGLIDTLLPGPSQPHIQIGFRRRSEQPNGFRFADEPSSRSRSLLFIALGLAVAAIESVPLWIPENGFASLNPPLGPERRGSLSTRTTHPAFLGDLARALAQIGVHSEVVNPFTGMTKGEMFTRAAEIVGEAPASELLSATHSCSLTGQRYHRVPIQTHCGVCFGCVVRRAAFIASGLQDRTTYIDATGNPALQTWLAGKAITRSVQDFLRRGIQPRDIASLSLPTGYATADALNLARRASGELARLYT
jgi:7-cyano-7-deazaguanine synthase in queuosine biosynthesis